MNKLIRQDEMEHMGIKGMKWGVHRTGRRTEALNKKVTKTVKKFDRGKEISKGDLEDLSKRVRQEKYKVDKKSRRAERFLAKSAKADAKGLVNRFNKNPEKKVAVEEYLKSMKIHEKTLSELLLQLIDLRL